MMPEFSNKQELYYFRSVKLPFKSLLKPIFSTGVIAGIIMIGFSLLIMQLGFEYYASGYLMIGMLLCVSFIAMRFYLFTNRFQVFVDFEDGFYFFFLSLILLALLHFPFSIVLTKVISPDLGAYIDEIHINDVRKFIADNAVPQKEQEAFYEQAREANALSPKYIIDNIMGEAFISAVLAALLSGLLQLIFYRNRTVVNKKSAPSNYNTN